MGRREGIMGRLLKIETLGFLVFASYVAVFSYVIGSVLAAAMG
jgi:hypothetical protein